jgi:tripartite-type tricarboxylate transporter receptor subunit TctC
LQEAGLNVTVVVRYGILASANTSEPVLARLRKEVADGLKDPKVLQRLTSLGYRVSFLPPRANRSAAIAQRRVGARE